MMKRICMTATMLLASVIAYAQRGSQIPAIDAPVHTVSSDGTLRIQLNGAVKDWLLGANVAPEGGPAKVQVFEIDRDYKDEQQKARGQGFAKSVSYPPVIVMSDTVQVNGLGSHDTTTVYVEAPAWTTIVVMGPKDEVLYQTPLRKTLLVSRGVEFNGPTVRGFKLVVPPSWMTHEARLRVSSGPARSILQTEETTGSTKGARAFCAPCDLPFVTRSSPGHSV
jgi:hypothetical protein